MPACCALASTEPISHSVTFYHDFFFLPVQEIMDPNRVHVQQVPAGSKSFVPLLLKLCVEATAISWREASSCSLGTGEVALPYRVKHHAPKLHFLLSPLRHEGGGGGTPSIFI